MKHASVDSRLASTITSIHGAPCKEPVSDPPPDERGMRIKGQSMHVKTTAPQVPFDYKVNLQNVAKDGVNFSKEFPTNIRSDWMATNGKEEPNMQQ